MRALLGAIVVGGVAGMLPLLLVADSGPPGERVAEWVVQDGASYSGRRGGPGEHYVTCVPEADLAKPYEQRLVWREVVVDRTAAYDYLGGESCPAGPIRLQSTDQSAWRRG